MDQSFRHAGQLGRDLAAVDWHETPLGEPASWPQSLKTTVRMMLASRFSMWMAWGPDLTFFCNDAYRRDTLGKQYPWALGRPAREVWAEIWPEIGPRIDAVLRTEEATWDAELQLFLERSGYREETYHTFSYSPLYDDRGDVSGMFCVVTEVTEEVVSRRRLDTLRSLGAQAADTLTVHDTFAAAARSFGDDNRSLPFTVLYRLDHDTGQAVLEAATGVDGHLGVAPPVIDLDDADALWPVAELAAGESVVVEGLSHRFAHVPTGPWPEAPLAAYAVPLRTQRRERPTGCMITGLNRYRPFDDSYRDFLELLCGQIGSALARASAYENERTRAEELERLDAAKTAFFTNVSHELRTPLTLLLGPAEDALADADEPLGRRQRARLELVSRNGERLLKLVNTLLDFSRLDSQADTGAFVSTDLAAYTRELAALFAPAIERAGLRFVVVTDELAGPVHVDRDLWAKCVLNLLSNALKFTFSGTITLSLRDTGEGVTLSVTDSGIGISPDDQEQLFERFHRVLGARSRSYEGTGVGLALVADVARLHSGAVTLDSEVGTGSTFTVTVPYGVGHLPSERLVDEASSSADPEVAVRGFLSDADQWLAEPDLRGDVPDGDDRPRVLVVDDNVDMRTYIAGLLADLYAVETAPDGLAALEAARRHPPDLVVTDVMMPRLDGFGLLEALHAESATTGVPVLMVSARAGDEGASEGLEAGADDYLMKPFTSRELLARVRANLELDRVRRTRDALARSENLLTEAQRIAQMGSFELDLRTGDLTGSDEAFRLLRLTPDGVAGRDLAGADLAELRSARMHHDDIPRAEDALARVRAGHPVQYDVRLRDDEGGDRIIRTRAGAVRDESGAVVAMRGTVQDITEQEATQQALTEATHAAEAARLEHLIAAELQEWLLPERSFDVEHLELATYYQAGTAGTQVGGDWYDVVDLGGGRAALVIGDVMGRGIRAAAMMGQLRTAVQAYARLDLSPRQVMRHLDAIVRETGDSQIVTCVYAVFDPRDHVLTVANAGHLPPVMLLPGAEPPRLLPSASGPPLGAGPSPYDEQRIPMVDGARLVLYTDGLVEQRGVDIDDGLAALQRFLAEDDGGVEGLPGRIVERLLPGGCDDDVALLVARLRLPVGDTVLSERLPDDERAPSVARRHVADGLRPTMVPADLVDDAALVATELVTNAVRYGEPPYDLHVRLHGGGVVIEVWDSSLAEPVPRLAGPDDEAGRGLLIVEGIADSWGMRRDGGRKAVWCLINRHHDTATSLPDAD